jgi:hypothetical protein
VNFHLLIKNSNFQCAICDTKKLVQTQKKKKKIETARQETLTIGLDWYKIK